MTAPASTRSSTTRCGPRTPFSCYHRVIDRRGHEHAVLLVGRGVRDDRGVVEKLEGFLVDIAPGVTIQLPA